MSKTDWATAERQIFNQFDKARASRHEVALEQAKSYAKIDHLRAKVRKTRLFCRTKLYRRMCQGALVVAVFGIAWSVLYLVVAATTAPGELWSWWTPFRVVVTALLVREVMHLRRAIAETREVTEDDIEDVPVDPEVEQSRGMWLAIAGTDGDRLEGEQWPGQYEFWAEAEMLLAEHAKLNADADAAVETIGTEDRMAAAFSVLVDADEFWHRWQEFLGKWILTDEPWGVPVEAATGATDD